MMNTRLREYALVLLNHWKDGVAPNKRMRERLEKLPKAVCWNLSVCRPESEFLEIRVGRRYYYIYYWTRDLFVEGKEPDWCVRIPKDSVVGKCIEEMLHDA